MRLFRSEEELDAWCAEHALPRGATLDLATLRELARRWYGDRLDPELAAAQHARSPSGSSASAG